MSAIWIRRAWVGSAALVALAALGAAKKMDWLNGDQLGVIAAVASVFAAAASWAATSRAADTADAVAAIERDRWHVELTPILEVEVHRLGTTERASLTLKLVGPPGLEQLDAVTVLVRDDDVDRTPRTAAPPTAEDVAAHIWGPLRFTPGIDDVAEPGRVTPVFPLAPATVKKFDMTNTHAPFWHTDDDAERRWRIEVRDQPVRLKIECRLEGHKPWFLYPEVKIRSGFAPQ
ncbi:hypothetical protein [Streptomyces sp.]|uniref:hypothetical protein n=1 Tax=Streptomyces sp. TaxID=1931 RepID=UPI002F942C90